jgi:hypothetical protein
VKAAIDHLVVGAPDLAQGVAWCEATLGVTPGPGGEHPLMGTHNRLLRIASPAHPHAYFEVIAVQPGRSPQQGRRWFDLDEPRVRDHLAQRGPQLLHCVARVDDVRAAAQALRELGIDVGEVVAASRSTASDLLQWQITLRRDGHRAFDGTLPALIQWGTAHPAAGMPDSGVTLHDITVRHPQAADLKRAYEAIGLGNVRVEEGPANLCAVLDTPRGRVRLESGGL